MEVVQLCSYNVSTFNEAIRIKQLDKSVCYGVIVEKVITEENVRFKKNKEIFNIIDYRKYTFVKDNVCVCKLDYINVKIDGVTYQININLLEHYLSWESLISIRFTSFSFFYLCLWK